MLRAWRSAAATFNGAVTVTLESIISALILGLSRVGNESLRRPERLGLSPFLGLGQWVASSCLSTCTCPIKTLTWASRRSTRLTSTPTTPTLEAAGLAPLPSHVAVPVGALVRAFKRSAIVQAPGRTAHEKVLVKIRFFLFFSIAIDYILHAALTGFLIASDIH